MILVMNLFTFIAPLKTSLSAAENLLFLLIFLVMNDLNNDFFQLSETEGCLVSPSVGQPCIALYEEMWYRAKVLSLSVNNLMVHYVDYGNDETLKPSAVKKMTPQFLKLPQVTIECSIDLNRDEWSEEATSLFEEQTGENQLIIKVLDQQGDRYQVKLFDKEARCISEEVFNIIPGAGNGLDLSCIRRI